MYTSQPTPFYINNITNNQISISPSSYTTRIVEIRLGD